MKLKICLQNKLLYFEKDSAERKSESEHMFTKEVALKEGLCKAPQRSVKFDAG